MTELRLREAVIAAAREMNALGINRGTSGNVSARFAAADFDGYLITPTGLPYGQMLPEDIVSMTMEGEAHGHRLPSSEWRFIRGS